VFCRAVGASMADVLDNNDSGHPLKSPRHSQTSTS
jgi:hypothetical protein